MTYNKMIGCVVAVLLGAGILSVAADVKMPAIFGDHMVLQQGMALPVWGTADAGEKVTVTVGGETGDAVAGADGKWMVKLPPLAVGTAPVTMTVTGKNTLTFNDVLLGDVWVCSGQSNMQFGLKDAHNAATVIPQANDPQLRLFLVHSKTAIEPQTDLVGTWQLCTPATVNNFSAVGYFFGRDLRTTLNRPIGLIGTYWGGTPAQAWTRLDAFRTQPILKRYADAGDKIRADYPQASADYTAKQAKYLADKAVWDKAYSTAYNAALKDWTAAVAKANAAGQVAPPRPKPPVPPPPAPASPDGGQSAPSTLYNGMIAPLIPFAIEGVIWYQGEANAGAGLEYRTLFATMITDWRAQWGEGDFPFLFVQLAGYKIATGWNVLRESQMKTLALPHTGMASALDIGDPVNIHPKDKIDVGLRLAKIAKVVAYGQPGPISGPIYDSMTVEGSTIRLKFTQTGAGLIIGTAPWTAPGVTPLPNTSLVGFQIAGQDKKWFPADAKIDGNTVVVSSAQVPQPVAVRYAWDQAPPANLYNQEGIPASPFRTDSW